MQPDESGWYWVKPIARLLIKYYQNHHYNDNAKSHPLQPPWTFSHPIHMPITIAYWITKVTFCPLQIIKKYALQRHGFHAHYIWVSCQTLSAFLIVTVWYLAYLLSAHDLPRSSSSTASTLTEPPTLLLPLHWTITTTASVLIGTTPILIQPSLNHFM